MGQEYIAQAGQLLVGFEPAEARGCLLHGNRDRKLAESLCPRRSARYASDVDLGTASTDARAIGLVGHIMEEWEQPIAVEIWRRVDEEVSEATRIKRRA